MFSGEEDVDLKDKTVIILGCEGTPSNNELETLNQYGLQVVVVDSCNTYYTAPITKFIQYDCKDGQEVHTHADSIVQRTNEMELKLDGCVSFTDLYVPLAAKICSMMGLPGIPLKAAYAASMKSLTHNVLSSTKYTGKVFLLNSSDEIPYALKYVGLPAVLKPELCSSIGSRIVKDEATAVSLYKQICKKEFVVAYGRKVYDKQLVLMEYLGGTEHGVDIVISEGRCIAAFVHDKSAPNKQDFKLSSKLMPSVLDKNQVDKLTEAAFQCCKDIGLTNGVFNVDIKMTVIGPKLIEINPRMGGNIIPEMIRICYNVDILRCCMLTTLGIKPRVSTTDPECYIAGMMCHESLHGRKLETEATKTLLGRYLKSGMIRYLNLQLPSDKTRDKHHQCPMSVLFVKGNSHREAVNKLKDVCDDLGLVKSKADFNYYLTNC